MRNVTPSLLAALPLALLAAATPLGCASSGGEARNVGDVSAAGGASPTAGIQASADNAPGAGPTVPGAPRDAAYTIYCRDFTGPNHAAIAENVKQEAAAASKLGDFYLVRGEQRTVLYHGFYITYDRSVDRREAERARRDRELIERLQDRGGRRIFTRSVFEPLARPDPAAPAEWALDNAQGYWSVLIATYTDPIERKQVVVEAVREARKMGVEAYYLHTDSQSHVLVGTWPRDAIKRHQSTRSQQENSTVDPNNPPPIVLSTSRIDPAILNATYAPGQRPIFMEMRLDILDPTLEATMRNYPYSVDGEMDAKPKPPLLVEIPRVTGRAEAIDEKPVEANRQPEFGKLLERPF